MISLNSIEDLELSRTIGKSAQSGDDCKDGIQCRNAKCEYNHPTEWDACEDGVDCKAYYCRANHPYGRRNPCPNGRECQASTCNYLHPLPEMEECPTGARCGQCDKGNTCRNIYCKSLHPIGWNPCKTSIKCTDPAYSYKSHPTDRNLSTNEEVFSKTPSVPRLLKSVEQRNLEREKAQLPILTCKDEFCQRLKEERILVVIAESGSGKTTQLPQYAAEYFGGLIVCTQPRVVAATSLAHRVANEYDGTSVGRSVGYRVGITNIISRTNRVPGTDILFMTDGALIQESTEDRQLTDIRILIIDEAHERSLNTDIVMGIAKLLLKSRPTDFYVVISSATIKCDKFLDFFERPDAKPLNVPGRVYEVDLHYLPPNNVPIEQHAVSTLQRLYHQNEGTTLVFLPGQREIERAIELFKHNLPDNCVPLPLYAALSADEQDQVLQFDEGPNGERRMVVFCTNIAETSLTIKNTRLVIDSGLCKEPFVDKEVGSTMIEVNKISRASAHQRRGRAGRTAPGCCIRLYNEQELIRPDIEPAIFRSSLNLIILQLIHLQLNPLEFPFIDPPDPVTIKTSLKLLKDLDAIDVNYNITLRGELFVKLNLDPRFCAFLVDTYIDHGPLLELTTTITAILTAPGSLFLIPTNDEEKAIIQNRVASGAQKYNSDLFYFASIYKQWCNAGENIDLVTRKCRVCHMSGIEEISVDLVRLHIVQRIYLTTRF
ncbi:hypothetical protein I4U23_016752 [Adineta vaga]|nr:hypothetical protein I4U23_016752 [Adineta vaga]